MAARGSCEFANDWQWLIGVPVASAFLVYWLEKPEFRPFQNPIVDSLAVAAITFGLTFVARFIVKLLAAPVQLHEEAERAVAKLQTLLDERTGRVAAIADLAELRKLGVAHRNSSPVELPDGFTAWQWGYENWRERVLEAAGRVSMSLKYRLEVLDQMRPPPTMPVMHPHHGKLVQIISEILLRIDEFLEKESHSS